MPTFDRLIQIVLSFNWIIFVIIVLGKENSVSESSSDPLAGVVPRTDPLGPAGDNQAC